VLSILLIATSIASSVAISLGMNGLLLRFSTAAPMEFLVGVALFNVTCVLQSLVGGIIEWQRPGHTIGRLLMLSGPLYAFLAAGWSTADMLERLVDPQVFRVFNWAGLLLSYPGVAVVGGWVPLLFPTGTLPDRRWRLPVATLVVLSGIGLAAWAVRPGPMTDGNDLVSPIGIDGWPGFLQLFVDAIPIELGALIALAIAALITRFKRGDRIERLQIWWLGASVALCGAAIVLVVVEMAIRTDDGPLLSNLVFQAGILAMPIAIGIAVTRYHLYEIDRLISRTIGWALVTGVLVVVFAGMVVGLQAILADVTQGGTLAVAASTLVAFALFQPVRRRVQTAVDHRFDRARYDGDRTAAAFAERLREQVDLAGLEADIAGVVDNALRPTSVRVWIRGTGHRGTA
jgi:hypothetical protein